MHEMHPLPLDHIGIAVSDLDKSIQQYVSDFGCTLKSREKIPSQKVEAVFLSGPTTMIELLVPTEKGSTLSKFIEKRGTGLHHLCYRVNDIEGELKRFGQLGYRLIDSAPRSGAHGTKISFLHPKSVDGVLIELCQYP